MEKLVVGILAHVDAGKTTLSEGILYLTGKIRKLGRVDHKDAYLDTYNLERERGITIFSKQAEFELGNRGITLLDTPGHVDFSAEMERTLQVLDYAILVINGADGVQGHTMTLWRLLARYQIPTFLFINKMDQDGTDKEKLLAELKKRLSDNCVDFTWEKSDLQSQFLEDVSVCDEELLEKYLETEEISTSDIRKVIKERKLFPCFFGSALKMTGVEEFLHGLEKYCETPEYPSEFGAKVFKIARDDQGNRLSYMKITGGTLKVKELLTDTEKADQIRIYSGAKFELAKEAPAGTICAVTGLSQTHPGQGFGIERESEMPVLEPVLNYRILLPEDCDVHQMLKKLKELEEEEPERNVHVFNSCSASSGEVLTALKIRELASSGMPFKKVVREVEQYICQMQTLFVLESLENLRKNGRLTKLQAVVTGALRIKLLMGATPQGEICKLGQALTMKQALGKLVDRMAADPDHQGRVAAVCHCNCLERAFALKEQIEAKCQFQQVLILEAGGITTVYANDGGVVVAY